MMMILVGYHAMTVTMIRTWTGRWGLANLPLVPARWSMGCEMARYWRTCSMGMESCGMASIDVHIRHQLQRSLAEIREHGRMVSTCSIFG